MGLFNATADFSIADPDELFHKVFKRFDGDSLDLQRLYLVNADCNPVDVQSSGCSASIGVAMCA